MEKLEELKQQAELLGFKVEYYDIIKEIDGDFSTCNFIDAHGCEYDTISDAIWFGIFDFCGCGDPRFELKRIYELLKMIDAENFEPICNDDEKWQIYLYLLHRFELTEHGSSIYCSFLTDKGKAVFSLLKEEFKEL